jgi:hypothetical protein
MMHIKFVYVADVYDLCILIKKAVSNKTNVSTAEFVSSRQGITELVGSKLDDAQYISLFLLNNSEKANGKIGIGNISTPEGRRYRLSVSGTPIVNNHRGEPIATHQVLGDMLAASPSREKELNYDALAYFEVEGETPTGKKYIGIFYSIADACKYLYDESEKGEL